MKLRTSQALRFLNNHCHLHKIDKLSRQVHLGRAELKTSQLLKFPNNLNLQFHLHKLGNLSPLVLLALMEVKNFQELKTLSSPNSQSLLHIHLCYAELKTSQALKFLNDFNLRYRLPKIDKVSLQVNLGRMAAKT